MNLRDELKTLGERSRGELSADAAMRGADRHRILVRTVVPVALALLVAVPFMFGGSGGGTVPPAKESPIERYLELLHDYKVDAWYDDILLTADGQELTLPNVEWTSVSRIPAGWLLVGPERIMVLRPDGESVLLSDQVSPGSESPPTVSADGTRVAWSHDGELWSARIADDGTSDVVHTTARDLFPYTWAGDLVIVGRRDASDSEWWTTWKPGEEPGTDWTESGQVALTALADETVVTLGPVDDNGRLGCVELFDAGTGAMTGKVWCNMIKGDGGGPLTVSPDGAWFFEPSYGSLRRLEEPVTIRVDCTDVSYGTWVDATTFVAWGDGGIAECVVDPRDEPVEGSGEEPLPDTLKLVDIRGLP